jgi:hypothetical protein
MTRVRDCVFVYLLFMLGCAAEGPGVDTFPGAG